MQDQEQQQGVVTDEAEPFMGAGRFGKNVFFYCYLTWKFIYHFIYQGLTSC